MSSTISTSFFDWGLKKILTNDLLNPPVQIQLEKFLKTVTALEALASFLMLLESRAPSHSYQNHINTIADPFAWHLRRAPMS